MLSWVVLMGCWWLTKSAVITVTNNETEVREMGCVCSRSNVFLDFGPTAVNQRLDYIRGIYVKTECSPPEAVFWYHGGQVVCVNPFLLVDALRMSVQPSLTNPQYSQIKTIYSLLGTIKELISPFTSR
ncbi:envelope glycoprotein L [Testudinid alphaherpesvirus 3]|uniref:Envelope glycoprotein L n=1 Tax=Testudinid alphaherpesvirus 3 TaxID=2560801 RepID=A0A0M3MX99_9ALPH|nr:envelope glycoprotein L [Testudinid alphaherpesvirus 3]AKI81681.1 envelope glycoprotein L [Testudinid alphaherpesvirus 3]AKI81728.1 envelope glycoprotein L [Testudinid alphaherpesvirus 3]AKI81784.1 envelope glycoprotein L [Testudinid alphaherpesvirus 3]AKI81824.1 envelope glycoprotein L [Testudinid alphaherpesvirus 3]